MQRFRGHISVVILAIFTLTFLSQGVAAMLNCDCAISSDECCSCYDDNNLAEEKLASLCDCCFENHSADSVPNFEHQSTPRTQNIPAPSCFVLVASIIFEFADLQQLESDNHILRLSQKIPERIYIASPSLRAPPALLS